MKYLVVYGAIGAAILVAMLLQDYLQKRRNTLFDLGTLNKLVNPNSSIALRLRDEVLLPLLAGLLAVVLWPVVLFLLVKSLLEKLREKKAASAAAFRISKGHLVERLTISEIEQREIVSDPHNAVTELPFGHLNKPWVAYLDELQPDGEIWSFSMTWENEWSDTDKVEGYVAVQNGQIGPHFINLRRSLSELD